MTLSELASELFIYLVVFRRKVAKRLPMSVEPIANDLELIFARMDKKAREDPALSERYESAVGSSNRRVSVRKALAIVTDGLVIGSDWDKALDYRSDHLLENRLYKSNEGGELFYEWLTSLPAHDAEAREIGFTALALGFQGRHARQPEVRLEMKRKLYSSLPERILEASEKVTPQAYQFTDDRDCTVPPVVPLLRYAVILVGLVVFLVILGNSLYNQQKSAIEDSALRLTRQDTERG